MTINNPSKLTKGILSDIAEIIMGQSPDGESYNKEGIGVPLINGPTEFGETHPIIIQWTDKPTKYANNNDLLLCVRGSSIGRMNLANDIYCIGRGVAAIRPVNADVNPDYLHFLIEKNVTKILKNSAGSTFPNLSGAELKSFPIAIPNLNEQQLIGDFFKKISKKIQLQQEKIVLLKEQKKGFMQKIFSQELRFKDEDGQEFPKWEDKKIKDIFTITRGKVLATNEISSSGNYPVYSSQTKSNGLLGYYDNYLFENAITWTTDGANAGDTNYRNGKFYCTNVCGVLLNNDGYANSFVAELINSVSHKYVSYVGNPKLMNNVMGEIELSIPIVKEQLQIANFIDILNNKIHLEEQKLESFYQQKQAFMQKMFI